MKNLSEIAFHQKLLRKFEVL